MQTHQGATSGSRTRRSQRGLLKVQSPAAGTRRDAAPNHKSTSRFIFITGLKHLSGSSLFCFTSRHRVVSKHRWCQPSLLLPTRNLSPASSIPPETSRVHTRTCGTFPGKRLRFPSAEETKRVFADAPRAGRKRSLAGVQQKQTESGECEAMSLL